MQNKAIDLNNHLFEQLERINDTSIKGEDLLEEFKRAEAMTKLAITIIANGRLVHDTMKLAEEHSISQEDIPDMLNGGQIISHKLKQIAEKKSYL